MITCNCEKYQAVKKLDDRLLTPCGDFCGNCLYYTKQRTPHCPGCDASKGRLFWGNCQVYPCAKEHKVAHCGECKDFPCDTLVSQFDPEYGQTSAILRVGFLAYRRKAGTEKYLEMVRKLEAEKKR